MDRIQEIEQRLEMRKFSKGLCNAPQPPLPFEHIDYEQQDIEYLLLEVKRYKEWYEQLQHIYKASIQMLVERHPEIVHTIKEMINIIDEKD